MSNDFVNGGVMLNVEVRNGKGMKWYEKMWFGVDWELRKIEFGCGWEFIGDYWCECEENVDLMYYVVGIGLNEGINVGRYIF